MIYIFSLQHLAWVCANLIMLTLNLQLENKKVMAWKSESICAPQSGSCMYCISSIDLIICQLPDAQTARCIMINRWRQRVKNSSGRLPVRRGCYGKENKSNWEQRRFKIFRVCHCVQTLTQTLVCPFQNHCERQDGRGPINCSPGNQDWTHVRTHACMHACMHVCM